MVLARYRQYPYPNTVVQDTVGSEGLAFEEAHDQVDDEQTQEMDLDHIVGFAQEGQPPNFHSVVQDTAGCEGLAFEEAHDGEDDERTQS